MIISGQKSKIPYRWLEDDTADNVRQWVEAQNKVSFAYLDSIPFRDKIHQRLTEVYNYPKYSSPFRAGDYYFFYKNDGLQNQSVIYVQKGLDGEPEVFIDPNLLAPDGTVIIFLVGFSKDNKYVTYSKSEAGSDWQEPSNHGNRDKEGTQRQDPLGEIHACSLVREWILLQWI